MYTNVLFAETEVEEEEKGEVEGEVEEGTYLFQVY